jgi:hypothetical protein
MSHSGGTTTRTRNCARLSKRSSAVPCVRRDVTARSCEMDQPNEPPHNPANRQSYMSRLTRTTKQPF